jgi:DNA-binding transcriptional MocR family regulator
MKPAAVSPPRSGPLYTALADSVQALIADGTLRPGTRVPSVRRMARSRQVSISTVLQAYTLLESRGYLEARPQSGFYVRPRLPLETPEPRMARPMARPSAVGISDLSAAFMRASSDLSIVPLGGACPDPALFPIAKLARLLGAAGRDDPALLGRYAMNAAYDPLAREIARRYLQAGAPLPHDELVITVGCTEAINLALRAVTRPGDTVAVETPGYFGFFQILQSLGLRVLEIPTDPRDGLCLDALEAALKQCEIKAVLVMPAFQNPLGACMPDAHKERLHRLLVEHDLVAIEDDIYGDLHFEDERPKPLKAWDTDGRVLLCGSFGKTLAPGARVGWVAPGRYTERVRRLKLANTLGTPVILQKTVADFLRNGGYDHHLRSIRRAYRHQVQVFSQAVVESFPAGTRISRPRGGFILWLELPAGNDAERLHAAALARRINTAPGVLFTVKERYRHCLRMNCGLPWSPRIEDAVRTLGHLACAQLEQAGARRRSA